MLHLLKRNFDKSFSAKSFSSARSGRSERNGGAALEEAEEGKPDRKVCEVEKPMTVNQETTWDAKDLEAKAAVKFNTAVFFKDLIYHVFYPLSIPLMMWLDGGVYALVNRFFVPARGSPGRFVYFQLVLGCSFYAFNGVSLFFLVQGNHLEFLYDIALVDMIWFMRNAVVATKYAFASDVDMKKIRTEVLDLSCRVHQTILGGWADPLPRTVLKQELLLAAVRCRNFLTNYCFQLDTGVDSFEAIRDMVLDLHLRKNDVTKNVNVLEEANRWLEIGRDDWLDMMARKSRGEGMRPASLPIRLYAAHVIRQSSSLRRLRRVGHTLLSQHLKKCAFFVSMSISILPFILRVLLGGHHLSGPRWTTYVVAISAFVILYFSMYSNIAFMMVGILDLRRRHYVATKLDELLRTGVYTGSMHIRNTGFPRSFRSRSLEWIRSISSHSSSSSQGSAIGTSGSDRSSLTGQGIVIDFHDVQSLQAWWITRVLVHNFGLGFFKRIKYYTTYFACYCGILIILIGLRLLKGIKKEDIYILVSVMVCLDVFLTLLALMVWPGGDINTMRQIQGATLTQCKLKLQMKINQEKDELTAEELKEYYTAMQTMSSISEAVRWDNSKHKISVCGFQAGEQLLSLIVAILTASVAIGAGQIVANVVNTD